MIGDRIKSLREKRGYSITELADLAGVSKSYLSYIERNVHNNPSLQVLSKIAAPLDSSLEYLLGVERTDRPAGAEDQLDEEWSRMIRQAVDEGMSKKDFHTLKELFVLKKWKERGDDHTHAGDGSKPSNIIILRLDS